MGVEWAYLAAGKVDRTGGGQNKEEPQCHVLSVR